MLDVLRHSFAQRALLYAALAAPACGVAGYFARIRNEVAGIDMFTHLTFVAILGALAAGLNVGVGITLAILIAAVLIPLFSARRNTTQSDTMQMLMLGAFVGTGMVVHAMHVGSQAISTTVQRIAFGSLFGAQSPWLFVGLWLATAVLIVLSRPLTYLSLDDVIARSAGVPTRTFTALYYIAFGLIVCESARLFGAFLVLAIIIGPSYALSLTRSFSVPPLSLRAQLFFALPLTTLCVLVGALWSFFSSTLTPAFTITTACAGLPLLLWLVRRAEKFLAMRRTALHLQKEKVSAR